MRQFQTDLRNDERGTTAVEFAIVGPIFIFLVIGIAFLCMGMDSAQSFYFFEQREEGRSAQARLVSSIFQWRATWGIGIVLFFFVTVPFW